MSPQAVDYSFSRPNPAELAAAGYIGALRYLAPLPNAKVITGDEIASLHANGLAVGFVWESTANRAAKGQGAGTTDALAADAQADALGIPSTVTIYYAVDFDAAPAVVENYFRGVNDVSRRPVGGYGSFRVVEHLLDAGLIVHGWQATAWSHGKRSSRAHLYQRVGGAPEGTDVNDVLQDDWGQWPAASHQPTENDMPLDQSDLDKIDAIVRKRIKEDGVIGAADPRANGNADVVARLTALEAKVGSGGGPTHPVDVETVKQALREGTG